MVIFLVFSLTSSSWSSWIMLRLCSFVHQSAAKGENNCHLFQRCLYLIEEMLTHFNQGNEKIRDTLLERWSGCDVQTESCEAWSLLVPPGECSALAHGPSPWHPLSISPLECVRLKEWLDISPNTPHSLSLVQPFLHLAVIWFRFISPFTPRGSLPWLPQPGQCPLPRASYCPLLHCIIAISCSSFSLWSSNPTDGRKLTQEVFSSWPVSVPSS